mmetsp:Transcript_2622/g.6300  ORF Transcript_2622/g.6300 Transcript_2622/m.6300 type:complete len:154 (+) Transcript_2622:621-1082(+)
MKFVNWATEKNLNDEYLLKTVFQLQHRHNLSSEHNDVHLSFLLCDLLSVTTDFVRYFDKPPAEYACNIEDDGRITCNGANLDCTYHMFTKTEDVPPCEFPRCFQTSYCPPGENVMAAGHLTCEDGALTGVWVNSGHYMDPSLDDAVVLQESRK